MELNQGLLLVCPMNVFVDGRVRETVGGENRQLEWLLASCICLGTCLSWEGVMNPWNGLRYIGNRDSVPI